MIDFINVFAAKTFPMMMKSSGFDFSLPLSKIRERAPPMYRNRWNHDQLQ